MQIYGDIGSVFSANLQISGNMLTVFSFQSGRERDWSRIRPTPKSDDSTAAQMHIVDFMATDESNEELQELLEIDGPLQLPCMLFFQVRDNELIDTFMINLLQKTKDEAFIEVRSILTLTAEALREIPERTRDHNQYIFDILTQSLRNKKFDIVVVRLAKKAWNLVTAFAVIVGLLG
jgi:hypothetical protein